MSLVEMVNGRGLRCFFGLQESSLTWATKKQLLGPAIDGGMDTTHMMDAGLVFAQRNYRSPGVICI